MFWTFSDFTGNTEKSVLQGVNKMSSGDTAVIRDAHPAIFFIAVTIFIIIYILKKL
jgi:hypothetical protein